MRDETTIMRRGLRRSPEAVSFRHHLRRATQAEHLATEAEFAPFHEAPGAHLDWFLAAQLAALRGLFLARGETGLPEEGDLLAQVIGDLERDCAQRGIAPVAVPEAAPLARLAAAYILLGSRLGTEVLRRRLAAACPAPLPHYFDPRETRGAWARVCDRLDALTPGTAQSERIVEDVRAAYAMFRAAAREARRTLAAGR